MARVQRRERPRPRIGSKFRFAVHKGYYLYRDGKLKVFLSRRCGADGQPARARARRSCPAAKRRRMSSSASRRSITTTSSRTLPVSRGSARALHAAAQGELPGLRGSRPVLPADTKTFDVEMPAGHRASRALPAAATASARQRGRLCLEAGFARRPDPQRQSVPHGRRVLPGGLLLAFTPCVLPMVPIVAGIIAGGGANVTRGRAFSLSLAYVLGMAATYTQPASPLRLPASRPRRCSSSPGSSCCLRRCLLQWRFNVRVLHRADALVHPDAAAPMQQPAAGGQSAGVVVMGALSALIVTTCVGPALVAALSVIGQSGQMARGGIRAVLHGHRHGRAAAGGGRLGGPAAAARRRLDGYGQAGLRRDDAGRRRVDAVAHPAGAHQLCCCGSCRCWRWPSCCIAHRRRSTRVARIVAGLARDGRVASTRCCWASACSGRHRSAAAAAGRAQPTPACPSSASSRWMT